MKGANLLCAVLLSVGLVGPAVGNQSSEASSPRSYLLPFWMGAALKGLSEEEIIQRDGRIKSVDGHPCGGMVMARVGRVPKADDAYLGPDTIKEVSSEGRVVGAWLVPIDGVPLAIDGTRIMVGVHDEAYWFGQDRSIAPIDGEMPIQPRGEDCPNNDSGFKGESYGCTKLVDRTSGQSRQVVSYFVCS